MNKKMNLKRIKKININIFNNKNFLIYLISFFIVGIIIGIIFFSFLNKEDLSLIANNVNKSLTINDNYNYINGKCTVTKIGSNGSNVSSLECKFSSYGRREIKCEVVYIPKVVTDVSLRKVGSGMTEVEIVPRSN